ncbi:MAG: hypothetical protein STSR0008_08690 [Ignavibacterium sp.]
MKWFFINSGNNNGAFNMDFDLYLTKNCSPDEAYFRLYRWKPYCISLGANQDISEIDSIQSKKDNIEIVKRPTGGKAILHSEEITYSIVLHLNNHLTPSTIYREINLALINGLIKYDEKFSSSELEKIQPDLKSFYNTKQSFACFANTAKSEVKYYGKKLIGSAQRKLGNIILQHGSILCGDYHQMIFKYSNLPEEDKLKLKEDLINKTITIENITNEKVDYNKLIKYLKIGFEDWLKTNQKEFTFISIN